MTESLLILACVLLLIIIILVIAFRNKGDSEIPQLKNQVSEILSELRKLESNLKEDFRTNRQENGQIAKDNRSRRASLLASRNHFAIAHLAILALGRDTAMRNALHAVRALLHDAAAAHADFRIAHHLVLRRGEILEEQEVEPPHLVRTIVRTVAGTDAAVVHHVVQAFGAVHCGADRANHFAGRVLALLARDRLVVHGGIFRSALVVHVDAQPLHLAATHRLLLANYRDVVFRLAGHDARLASHAGVHVDGHAPLQLGVLIVGVQRHLRTRRLDVLVRKVRILDEVFERRLANNVAVLQRLGALRQIGIIDVLEALRMSEAEALTNLLDVDRGEPGSIAATNFVAAETHIGSDVSGLGASIAEVHGYGVVGMSRLRPDRPIHLAPVHFDLDDVAGVET